MSLEIEIVSYLNTYGNTKESDLAKYATKKLGQSPITFKKILDRMVLEGKIRRLIHNKLGPKAVYFTLGEPLPNETLVNLETEVLKAAENRGKRQENYPKPWANP